MARTIVAALGGTWNGDRGVAHCPAHDDRTPSLSVSEGPGGRTLVRCHAGCSQDKVIRALKLRGLWSTGRTGNRAKTKMTDRDNKQKEYERLRRARGFLHNAVPAEGTPAEAYLRYRGLDIEIPKKIRFNPFVKGFLGVKRFPAMVARIHSHNGKFVGSHVTVLRDDGRGKALLKGSKKTFGVLKGKGAAIRLHPAAKKMVVGEGLESTLSAHQICGLPAWCGISAPHLRSLVLPRKVKEVVIAADHDEKGIEAADELAERLVKEGRVVRVAVPERFGADWNDMLCEDGADLDELKRAILRAPKKKVPKSTGLRVVTTSQLRKLDLPPRRNLLSPWLPEQGLVMVHAPRGVGKTYFSLGVAYALTHGEAFLRWPAEVPGEVLYIDGEMPASLLQERIRAFDGFFPGQPLHPLRLLTPDLQERGMPDLATQQGQAAVDALVRDETALVIIDAVSTLVRSGEENTAEGWLPVQDWALRHRAERRSILFVHHSGKSGLQRGTSRREDVLDTVINLRRPPNYSPEEGAAFEVHFEKARGMHGVDAKPFAVQLTIDSNGAMQWVDEDLPGALINRVAEMLNKGAKQKDIAAELEVSEARVSQLAGQAREQGLTRGRKKRRTRR